MAKPGSLHSRYPGLDWLRAAAALLVVLFHAGIPYMTSPLPGMEWCTDDRPAQSGVVNAIVWGIDTFVMPVFFLLGGFLARRSCRKAGPGTFLRQRSLRLGAPLVTAFALILPSVLFIWLFGWICDGRTTPEKLRHGDLTPTQWAQLTSPGHLWFLPYLWTFCAGGAAMVFVGRRNGGNGAERKFLPGVLSSSVSQTTARLVQVAALFATSVLVLFWQPITAIGFRSAPVPQLPNLLYYAPCFALGWLLSGWNWRPSRFTGFALLMGAAALFPGLRELIARHVASPREGGELVQLVLLFTACGWLAATGLFAFAVRSTRQVPPAVTYLAEASLWIYVAHVPPLALTQISLTLVDGYGAAKMILSVVIGLAGCLLVYELAVRGQRIESLLNGVFTPKRIDSLSAAVADRQDDLGRENAAFSDAPDRATAKSDPMKERPRV